jgi:hypothetical protein
MEQTDVLLRYRGRAITTADVIFIRELMARHPAASRRRLSVLLCGAWNWVQANGVPREMICRGLMLALERGGHLVLPPPRRVVSNPLVKRAKPAAIMIEPRPLRGPLSELQPVEFHQVRRTAAERLFNSLIEQHHYLGYTQPVGEHLKYMVYAAGGGPIACLAWSSAPRHLGPRDRFIGWSAQARRRNLHLIAYNTRFVILPWVQVAHLASHLLGRMARSISADWQRVYGHPVYYLESFVEPGRYAGTCYRAANWRFLGPTTGRGKQDSTKRPNRPVKEVLGYPLTPRFRELLSA